MKHFLFVCFFGISLTHASTSQDKNLVTITSKYQDQLDPNKQVEIQGTGFLVEAKGRTFVLTASHVSSGSGTKITWNQQNLTIVGRVFDGVGDMEVLEVQGDHLSPSFHFDGELIKWNATEIGLSRWLDKFDFILLNSWVFDPNLDVDNQTQSHNLSSIDCELNCELLSAETLVQPGASGSPLVTKIPTNTEWPLKILKTDWREELTGASDGTYVLRGMAIRRERFFSRSSFIPAWRLSDLLRRYLSGHGTSSSVWHVAGTLQYRSFNGIQESAVIAASSGNGVTIDGGSGLATFAEDQPQQILSTISPFPVGGSWITNWWALKAEDANGLVVYPLWFDMEHYAPNFEDTLPIKRGQGADPIYWETIRMRFGDASPGASFVGQDGRSKLKFAADRVNLELEAAGGEKIIFGLDKNGALCVGTQCAAKFLPVVEVPGNLGNEYLVDLRAFYLMNVSSITSALFKDPAVLSMKPSEIDALKIRVLDQNAAKIKLLYRKKRTSSQPMTVMEGSPVTVIWTN